MTQNEKVTVKLTLEMDVKSARITFTDCETAEEIVDCMVQELSYQFANTGSGLTITGAEVVKKNEHLHDEMSNEEALEQLKMDRDLCNFNPMTGKEEPMNEDCRKSATALDIAIKALERMSCEDVISRELALEEADKLCLETCYDNEKVETMLKDLPSVVGQK